MSVLRPTSYLRIHLTNYATVDIQSKKQRPCVVWTLQGSNDVSRPASEPAARLPEKSAPLSTDLPRANASALAAPLPATNAVSERSHDSPLFQELGEGYIERFATPGLATPRRTVTRASGSYEKSGITRTADPRFRRFHLSHESFPRLKRQPSFTGGIRKHRKPQRDHLALFVETEEGERLIERSIRAQGLQCSDIVEVQDDHVKTDPVHAGTSIRKRPNASATERAWRAATWGKRKGTSANDKHQTANANTTNWDHASLVLAEELHQFALEESKTEEKHPQDVLNSQLKFKPKPPKPREPKVDTDIEFASTDTAIRGNFDEDSDYIVDTYIRSSLQPLSINASPQTHLDPLQELDSSKVGILVIEEEQEALWETFANEQLNEPGIESDEEDENGLSLPTICLQMEC